MTELFASTLGVLAGLFVAFVLACALALVVSTTRRIKLLRRGWKYEPSTHYPQARRME